MPALCALCSSFWVAMKTFAAGIYSCLACSPSNVLSRRLLFSISISIFFCWVDLHINFHRWNCSQFAADISFWIKHWFRTYFISFMFHDIDRPLLKLLCALSPVLTTEKVIIFPYQCEIHDIWSLLLSTMQVLKREHPYLWLNGGTINFW